ncbi:MAG: hypothetical protein RLZZ182_978 [Pseudomonadota bacterium]
MTLLHNLGFPRVGARRELKFALEACWRGETSLNQLKAEGARLRQAHWQRQAGLNLVPVGDFSFYDHVLDMGQTLGHLPERARTWAGDPLDNLFRVARGRATPGASEASCCAAHGPVAAGEMTKWFDTNYHYIVPEFHAGTTFELDASRLIEQVAEARQHQADRVADAPGEAPADVKPVIIGPVTYLALGKAKDGSDRLALLERLLPVYARLLQALAERGVQWVQIDEPILTTELDADWKHAFQTAYHQLKAAPVKLLLTTYFGPLRENLHLAVNLPVAGLHLDAVRGREDLQPLLNLWPSHKVLSLGVIDGRNVWATDLNAALDWLEPVAERLGGAAAGRLWLAPSCSLLHVPVDLAQETELDAEVRPWLAFAQQKLQELQCLGRALREGRAAVAPELQANQAACAARRASPRVQMPAVRDALARVQPAMGQRQAPHTERAQAQARWLKLPLYPTTTIGSFPQTPEIRQARSAYKAGQLSEPAYREAMQAEIARAVREQEALGLDVLVHGEAERNDMVEYFGEQLEGFAFTRHGWVQSYGSRCVKPPILFGDVQRPRPMTVAWTQWAQSLTARPMKGMLTGPVTLLNWSFVRDDQPREATCLQLALAVRQEVLDLERAGVQVIQIDEAALREGLPLRRSEWPEYLRWAVEAFRLAAIAALDADVITIETSRSDMELLQAFERFDYPNQIGPGVYDIHSPNVPTQAQIEQLMRKAAQCIPAERLWVNPDCGLKTRQWPEVIEALRHMVAAAQALRQEAGVPLAA